MSIVPLLVNLARELDTGEYHHRDWDNFMDDDFGFGIHPVDIFRPTVTRSQWVFPNRRRTVGPYDRRQILARRAARPGCKSAGDADKSGAIMPTIGKDGFQVCMDVSQFKPNELSVKTIDNTVLVEGKHEEREDDHGSITRHFVRKYTLPKDYDAKEVISTVSSDGVLTVKAPPPPNKGIKHKERVVQIQQTGPAHLNVKAPEQKDDKQSNGEKMETGK